MASLKDQTAIVGVGQSPFASTSERSARSMAMEAIHAAILDAGLRPDDIDGLESFTFDPIPEFDIVRSFGLKNLMFFGQVPYGNGCGAVSAAALAVATGQAKHVAVFRSVKAPMGHAYDYSGPMDYAGRTQAGSRTFYSPFGLLTVSHYAAILAQRYLHKYSADPSAFGWITVACREHGSRNPLAIMHEQAITIDEYLKAPIVASPLRTLDCNIVSDGASAVIVTTAERARELARPPVYIMAAAQGTGPNAELVTNYNRPEIEFAEECHYLATDLFERAGVTPGDVDFVQIYDHVSALVLLALEGLGFCKPGEAADFVQGAHRITVGGELPLNTHGGHLGEAYVQTMNHIVEASRQLRGDAAVQVSNAEVGLVLSGNAVPSSGLLLRR